MIKGDALELMDDCRHQLLMARRVSTQLTDQHQPNRDSIDITVAIPTYNGSCRLPFVLERLKKQANTSSMTWEVIVADNNSRDETATVIKRYQQQWPENCLLRYAFAAEQGAAFARQRAVAIARGRIVAFLDDDNLPVDNWVINVHRFAQTHPRAGAFGSQIHGDFEGPLPEALEPMACFLAIVERGSQPHLYDPEKKMLPPGAGLAVRRQAWLQSVPKRLFLNHKGKKAGLASEDLEAILHIQKAGWEVWYNPEMVVYHRIPNSRLQVDYMRSLLRCVGLSRFYIRMLGIKEWQRPLMIPAYIANDIRRLTLHYFKEGQKSVGLSSSESCTREYLKSTVASPFFLLKKAFQSQLSSCVDQIRFPQKQLYLDTLTKTFEQESFFLYHQPVMGVTEHFQTPFQQEFLVRLPHTVSSKLFQDFWRFAESYNLAGTIDQWVIAKVFQELSKLSTTSSGIRSADLLYSINLSRNSVLNAGLPDFINRELIQKEVQAQKICFEIPTDAALDHPKETQQLTNTLQEIGCHITLDNFGTKRVSSGQIYQLSFNFIKANSPLRNSSHQLKTYIKQIQDFLHSSKPEATLIAKGIESVELLEFVRHMGIGYAQGYQLSKPQIWSAQTIDPDALVN